MLKQTTLKEYMDIETIYVDSNVIFGYIKSLIHDLTAKNKPLHKNHLKKVCQNTH